MIFQEGETPKVEFKVKKRLGYKRIPGWVSRNKGVGDRDFEIIKDTIDFIVARDPSLTLYQKEYTEHQRQIAGDRYIDGPSQEATEIEAKARARVLKDWPGATIDNLD